MSKDIKDLKPLFLKSVTWFKRYYPLLMFIAIAGMYGYLVLQINSLSHLEPTDQVVSERIKEVRKPNIDPQTALKLKALEDNSQEVQALFKAARENPFQE